MSISYHKNGLVSSHQYVGRWFIFYVLCSKNILMKLVDCQQPTCLCVKVEFVVGTISLSCKLYSLSWSCFRWCGVSTIAYRKLHFVSHEQCCRTCMVSTEFSQSSHGRRKGFFQGEALGDFSKIFPGVAKSGEICFSPTQN